MVFITPHFQYPLLQSLWFISSVDVCLQFYVFTYYWFGVRLPQNRQISVRLNFMVRFYIWYIWVLKAIIMNETGFTLGNQNVVHSYWHLQISIWQVWRYSHIKNLFLLCPYLSIKDRFVSPSNKIEYSLK